MAYVREGDQWIQWNDEVGVPVTWQTVKEKEAYILLWKRMEVQDDLVHTSMTTEDEGWKAEKEMDIEVEDLEKWLRKD